MNKTPVKQLFFVLSAVFLMNLFDAWSTLSLINQGHAVEANPLMQSVLDGGGWCFLLFKASIGLLFVTCLWHIRRTRFSLLVSRAVAVLYCLLTYWHCYGTFHLWS